VTAAAGLVALFPVAISSRLAVVVRARYHLVGDVSGVHTDFLETQAGVHFVF